MKEAELEAHWNYLSSLSDEEKIERARRCTKPFMQMAKDMAAMEWYFSKVPKKAGWNN